MYTLKSIARRGATLSAAFVLVVSSLAASAAPAFADALNPLTERSLTLSSSSPGWADTDGSGNSTYAPPNSGANGKKSGNYFSFKVSTDSTASGTNQPITAMSFQYCTQSAGACTAPGNDTVHGTDDPANQESDLNVHYPTAAEVGSSNFGTVIDTGDDTVPSAGSVKAVPGYTNENPKYQTNGGTGDPAEAAKNVAGNFIVMYHDPAANSGAGGWVQSTGWTATTSNQEEAGSGTTGQQNAIILKKTTGGGLGLPAGAAVKVLFFATANDYITNPGEGAFFVKINTFKNFTALAGPTPGPENTLADNIASGDVIDGGVTVANVMNQSIQITTKVLETMQFSVGTVDPNTLTDAELGKADDGSAGAPKQHTPCDTIKTAMVKGDPENVLQLGNQDAESSLETAKAYATHSYWRLSSNSSAGATVYYSGHTLSNTSGDEIAPIGKTAKHSAPGSEQFGLAIASATLSGNTFNTADYGVNYAQDRATGKNWENGVDNDKVAVDDSVLTDLGADLSGTPDYTNLNKSYHTPRLDPLTPADNYGGGSGKINGSDSLGSLGTNEELGAGDANAAFAFDALSDTIPAAIATESSQVVDCVTAKMRYVGNIAATTPAGIYTTKINYIAAPQY